MATMLNTQLSAIVTNLNPTPNGRKFFKAATHIQIMSAGRVVGSKTLGGRYSQADALREFRRNPTTFAKGEGWAIFEAGLAR